MAEQKDSLYEYVLQRTGNDGFKILPVITENWNEDLSPWKYTDGKNTFAGNGERFLSRILSIINEIEHKEGDIFILAGYSLAGLFCLWAANKSGIFSGVASCSGSLWFPGFYQAKLYPNCLHVYLSLGDKEHKTKHPLMSKVQTITENYYRDLQNSNRYKYLVYELNPGNHFTNPTERLGKGIVRLIENYSR